MAITSIKTGSSFTNLVKYNDFLGPNPAFNPSSYESIASATGTGSSGVITFSSIPSGYASLQIRGLARSTIGSTGLPIALLLTINGNSTTTDYITHELRGTGSAAAASSTTGVAGVYLNSCVARDGVTAGLEGVSIIDIHDYASTTKNKTIRAFTGYDSNDTNGRINLQSGLFINTGAITSITLTAEANNWTTNTVFALYGIKG
jgi:hypothetical protein